MKPRIYISTIGNWNCKGGRWYGYGPTPKAAYIMWRHNRKMGRLSGIASIRITRRHDEMKVAARQQRVKDDQSKRAEVVEVKPPTTWAKKWVKYYWDGMR